LVFLIFVVFPLFLVIFFFVLVFFFIFVFWNSSIQGIGTDHTITGTTEHILPMPNATLDSTEAHREFLGHAMRQMAMLEQMTGF